MHQYPDTFGRDWRLGQKEVTYLIEFLDTSDGYFKSSMTPSLTAFLVLSLLLSIGCVAGGSGLERQAVM